MLSSNSPDPDLLKTLLQPLLDDFQYWFERSQTFLESHEIEFLDDAEQADLLARVKQAQQEVRVAHMLLQATDGKVGIESSVLMPWHQLVTECWKIAVQFRLNKFPE